MNIVSLLFGRKIEMPHVANYDLSFVAPHRRDEVLRRIAILEAYLEDPTRAVAEQCAKEMGVNIVHLYNLARIWRDGHRPEELPGAGRPRKRRQHMPRRLELLIAQAVSEAGNENLEPIIDRLRALANQEGVTLPGLSTVRKYIASAMAGKLPESSYAANSDWVVDHCVVDLPIASEHGHAARPLATMLIDIRKARVLGVVLAEDGPRADSVARVFLRAIDGHTGPEAERLRPINIAFESFPGKDWEALETLLIEAGYRLQIRRRKRMVEAETAHRLLGSWRSGVRLQPRGARRSFASRPATLPAGRPAMSMDAAEELLQRRWEEASTPGEPVTPHGWTEALTQGLFAIARQR